MSPTKLITVLGATGNQGGSVVNTFLDTPGWKVRGITRSSSSAKAKDLAARGVEIVEANMDDASTLPPAFAGSHAIFAVSDFWGIYGDPANQKHRTPEQPLNAWAAVRETEQLKAVIDAAAAVPGLERFIFSSLSDTTKWSKGKYTHNFHFDSKANAETYGRESQPRLWAKTSVYHAGLFISNFLFNPAIGLSKNADGVVQLIGDLDPDVKQPLVAPEEDSGPVVKALLEDIPGKSVIGTRSWTTMRDFMKAVAAATGLKAEAVKLPEGQSAFEKAGELRLEFKECMAYFNEIGYTGGDPDVVDPKDLANPPQLASVEDYLNKQDWGTILRN